MELFGEKLKKLRESVSLSQEQLANELFVSRSAVAKWEQGRGFPNIDSLQLIAARFNLTIDELVNDKELKILEINNDKQLSLRKKIIIILSLLLAAVILCGAILTAMFAPRKLSAYLRIDEGKISSVCLRYVEFEEAADGADNEEIFKTVHHGISLDKDKYAEFTAIIKNLRVQPRYTAYLSTSIYSYYITCGSKVYEINRCYIKADNKKYSYGMLADYEILLSYFGIPEDLYLR